MKSTCSELFIATYQKLDNGLFGLSDVAPMSPKPQKHSSLIRKISPTFDETYRQSTAAEAANLHQLAGMGLYKSLDFLIRDFLLSENSDQPQINTIPLTECIETFIDDPKIRNCARLARWFSDKNAFHLMHWDGKDIENIKLLIRLTINWIESSVLAKQFAETADDFKVTHPPQPPPPAFVKKTPVLTIQKEEEEEESGESEDLKEVDVSDIEGTDIVSLLSRFSISHSLDAKDIRDLISFLELRKYAKGEYIVRKGDQGRNLYIILSGKAEVIGEDGLHIAILERGEILGEMSLISGNPITATVRVIEAAELLCLNARDFGQVLNRFPSVQMFFAKLLADRLMKTNKARSEEFASGMAGKLSEMQPSELFQVFNINQKTGILSLNLIRGRAEIAFRDGQMLRVRFGEKEGVDAFFELLKEKEGRFKFLPELSSEDMKLPKMGDFMWLLMEGMRKMDEETRRE
jgi:CRP-like cAMP-binding protein